MSVAIGVALIPQSGPSPILRTGEGAYDDVPSPVAKPWEKVPDRADEGQTQSIKLSNLGPDSGNLVTPVAFRIAFSRGHHE